MISPFRHFIFAWWIATGFLILNFGILEVRGDQLPCDDSQTTMVAESVLYLQKAISQIETNPDIQSLNVRIAPIVTVTTGLLDAGVSPDEPILQSSLCFLQRFYHEGTVSAESTGNLDACLAKIRICLDKARQNSNFRPPNDLFQRPEQHPESLDDKTGLLKTLDSLGDSVAIFRARKFVQKLSGDKSDNCDDNTENEVFPLIIDEVRYITSPGFGGTVRIHDLGRTLAKAEMLPMVDGFSVALFDGFLAKIHGLPNIPTKPHEPRSPHRKSFFAVLSTLPRLNGNRKKSGDTLILVSVFETYHSLFGAFEPYQSVLRKHLLADNLSVLQTVRRLE